MMENRVEFIIPGKITDLCSVAEDQYVVYDIMAVRDIVKEVKILKSALIKEDDGFIFNHFDLFYSIIRQFHDVDSKIRYEAYDVLMEVGENLITDLSSHLQDGENCTSEQKDTCEQVDIRFKYRNLVKMIFYLLCQFTEAFECEILKPATVIATTAKKGRKKKNEGSSDVLYEDKRYRFISLMARLCNLPFNKLWHPPIVEYEFINTSTSCFFKILENPGIKNSETMELIYEFLGCNLKSRDIELAYSIKIWLLIQDHQHLPVIMASAVHAFITKYGKKSFLAELLSELDSFDSDEIAKETARIHNVAHFLIELSKKCPDEVLGVIDLLLPSLEEESHILRNCILSVIGEIIIKIASCEEICEAREVERDRLILVLMDHVLDLNAFVRSKVLQILKNLVEENALSLYNQLQFAQRILGRIRDRTSIVRKNSIEFFKSFVMAHPFAVQLPATELQESYMNESKKLEALELAVSPQTGDTLETSEKEDMHTRNFEKSDYEVGHVSVKDHILSADKGLTDQETDCSQLDKEVKKQRLLVEYLKLIVQSANVIISTMPLACELLKSSTVTDVLEAIDYVTTAFQLGLKEAVLGIKEMMRLIFSNEPAVKNAVAAAYRRLYLITKEVKDGKEKRIEAEMIAKNLVLFLHGATVNEKFAIAEFIKEFTKNGDITDDIIEALWKNFELLAEEGKECDRNESYSSLVLLSMISSVNSNIFSQNVSRLTSIGFGPSADTDFVLIKETCSALMKIDISKIALLGTKEENAKSKQVRLHRTNGIFLRLCILLAEGIEKVHDNRFCPMAEKAITLIFKLADCPEKVCLLLIQGIARRMKIYLSSEANIHPDIKIALYVRFIFICGHVVLCYTTYLENDVISELKRRERLKQERREKAKRNKPNIFNELPSAEKNGNYADDVEFEGTETEDEILCFINQVLDNDVLCCEHFFGILYRFISNICKVSVKSFDAAICSAATLSLTKFMTVSAVACEQNMQLIMTILEKSPDSNIRSNIIISLGDLIMRFPNIVQPWTANMFKRLQDESANVRLSSLIILTHLILHDMIKVKGQISDVALCMVDNSGEIVAVVKYLFKELSKKKNALYNLLPDLFSGLSDESRAISVENFETIMKHVFQFIGKDKEVENLVEKLCIRLKNVSSSSQIQKIMFSLTLFNMSEKCVRKLLEHKDGFKNKVDDEKFVKFMKEIITNAKKHNVKLEEEINVFASEIGLNLSG